MGLESVWKRRTHSQFFFMMFIWNIFYFTACCPVSGHLEELCLSLFLPTKYLCTLTRCLPGFLSDQDPNPSPLLSCASPWQPFMEPFQHIHVRFGLGAQCSRGGLTSAEQRGRLLLRQPRSCWHFGDKQSPGGCQLSMLLCNFTEAESSCLSASKGKLKTPPVL